MTRVVAVNVVARARWPRGWVPVRQSPGLLMDAAKSLPKPDMQCRCAVITRAAAPRGLEKRADGRRGRNWNTFIQSTKATDTDTETVRGHSMAEAEAMLHNVFQGRPSHGTGGGSSLLWPFGGIFVQLFIPFPSFLFCVPADVVAVDDAVVRFSALTSALTHSSVYVLSLFPEVALWGAPLALTPSQEGIMFETSTSSEMAFSHFSSASTNDPTVRHRPSVCVPVWWVWQSCDLM